MFFLCHLSHMPVYAHHMLLNIDFFQGYSIGYCSLGMIFHKKWGWNQPEPMIPSDKLDVRSRKAFWTGTCGMTISAALRLPLGRSWQILADLGSFQGWRFPWSRLLITDITGSSFDETSMLWDFGGDRGWPCLWFGRFRVAGGSE